MVPLLVIVPVPPATVSRLPRPTSTAKSDVLLIETLVAVTAPPPVIESTPLPAPPTERLPLLVQVEPAPSTVTAPFEPELAPMEL